MNSVLSQSNDNDRVDNNVLFALYRGAVHFLLQTTKAFTEKPRKLDCRIKYIGWDNVYFYSSDIRQKHLYSITPV